MAATRTPFHVARSIRAVADRIVKGPLDELVLSPEAQQSFVKLLRDWAADLGTLPRTPIADLTTETLASELDAAADLFAGDAMMGGDGQVMFNAADAAQYIAWLRDCARRAALLQMETKGFRFVPVGELPPDPGPALPVHPDDVVPATRTGTGAVVTHALLDRLAQRRRFRAAPSGGSAA